MAFSQGSRHGLSYVAESTYGTTPGTPSMLPLRYTGNALGLVKENYVSEEIRSDRQISDMRHGQKSVRGNVDFEFSHASFDDILESALFGTWAADVLKAGTALQSFTMERRFEDITQFIAMPGCVVDTLALSIPPTGMVTGTFGFIGKNGSASGTSLGTPAAAATTSPFASAGGSLSEGGSGIATVTSLDFTLSNGIDPNFVIGSDVTPQLSVGRSALTGNISVFVEDMVLFNKFVNETESDLSIVLTDLAANTITIDIPRIKYNGAEMPVTSEGSVVMNMPFQALYDATETTNIKITRS